MEPPVARARDRRRRFAAVSLLPLARCVEHGLNAAATGEPAVIACIFAAEDHRRRSRGADLRAALSGRAGRGPARGQGLQYLAGYRWRADSIRGAAVL